MLRARAACKRAPRRGGTRRLAGVALTLLLAAVVPTVTRAAAGADSLTAPPPSSVGVMSGTPRTPVAARRDSLRRRPWHEQPRIVMARSLLLPGWGQLHNHAWIKAVLVAGAEGLIGARIVQDQRALDGLLRDLDRARADGDGAREAVVVTEYNARLDQRLGREWILGGVIAYALVDAYVDANFRGFDLEFRTDPALPAGASPAARSSGGGGPGLRIALRWDF